MVRSRVYSILAGYEDQNDHDTLRADPVFKLVADRSPNEGDLASQPTLSRFENAISIPSLERLRDVFLDQFIASFDSPPRHLTFDLDAVDDPAHGHQRLTFWHGYYDPNPLSLSKMSCGPLIARLVSGDPRTRTPNSSGQSNASVAPSSPRRRIGKFQGPFWPSARRRDAAQSKMVSASLGPRA
jgi:hypothetical protein